MLSKPIESFIFLGPMAADDFSYREAESVGTGVTNALGKFEL